MKQQILNYQGPDLAGSWNTGNRRPTLGPCPGVRQVWMNLEYKLKGVKEWDPDHRKRVDLYLSLVPVGEEAWGSVQFSTVERSWGRSIA